jgi:hypothetical protein
MISPPKSEEKGINPMEMTFGNGSTFAEHGFVDALLHDDGNGMLKAKFPNPRGTSIPR